MCVHLLKIWCAFRNHTIFKKEWCLIDTNSQTERAPWSVLCHVVPKLSEQHFHPSCCTMPLSFGGKSHILQFYNVPLPWRESKPALMILPTIAFPLEGRDICSPDSWLHLRLSSSADSQVGIFLRYFEMKKIWSCLLFLMLLLSVLPVIGKMITWEFLCRLCKQCVNLPVQLTHFQRFLVSWISTLPGFSRIPLITDKREWNHLPWIPETYSVSMHFHMQYKWL